jgi:hypothetical protein
MGLFDSTQSTKPNMPGYVKDFQKDVMKGANNYFNWQTANPNKIKERSGAYTDRGYALFNPNSTMAFDGLTTLAGNNSGANGMAPHLQGIMSSGGFTPGQTEAIGGMKDLANNAGLGELINGNGLTGDQNAAFGGLKSTVANNSAEFGDVFNRGGFSQEGRQAFDDLRGRTSANNDTLQGTFEGGGMTDDQRLVADRYRAGMGEQFGLDPAYLRVKQQAMDAQNDALDRRSAAAGRYGGGIDQAILAREQGNLSDRMDVSEMDKWRARTNAAAGDLANISQQGTNTQLGINAAQQAGTQGVLGAAQQGTNTQLALNDAQKAGYKDIADMGALGVGQRNTAIGTKSGLLGSVFNSENAGLDRMGQAYQTAQQPFMTQRAVGQEYENQEQKRINDEMRVNAELDPMNRYRDFLSLATGTPTGTTSTTSPSWAQILAGGGLGVLGLGSLLGGIGTQPSAASAGAVA